MNAADLKLGAAHMIAQAHVCMHPEIKLKMLHGPFFVSDFFMVRFLCVRFFDGPIFLCPIF